MIVSRWRVSTSILVAAVASAAAVANAEPRFAARMGTSCRMCHINPTGGGLRNPYGRNVFETQILASELSESLSSSLKFDSEIADLFAIGADFRMAYIGQPTRKDGTQYRTVAAGLFLKTPTEHTFFPMQADIYISADLGDHVTFYADIGAQGSFETFALFHGFPLGAYVKLGFFTPPYGTKLPNHTAAIRQPSGFDPRGKDAGIEIGIVNERFDLHLAIQNGNLAGSPLDLDRGKSFSGKGGYILNTEILKLQVGASALYIEKKEKERDPDGNEITSTDFRAGPYLWVSMGRFTWLGEALYRWRTDGTDITSRGLPRPTGQLTTYQELNFIILRGLEIAVTHEWLDRETRHRRTPADLVNRFGVSATWFPMPYVEANVIYRAYVARDDTEENGQHEVIAFLHLFF